MIDWITSIAAFGLILFVVYKFRGPHGEYALVITERGEVYLAPLTYRTGAYSIYRYGVRHVIVPSALQRGIVATLGKIRIVPVYTVAFIQDIEFGVDLKTAIPPWISFTCGELGLEERECLQRFLHILEKETGEKITLANIGEVEIAANIKREWLTSAIKTYIAAMMSQNLDVMISAARAYSTSQYFMELLKEAGRAWRSKEQITRVIAMVIIVLVVLLLIFMSLPSFGIMFG
ncbi:MAG: hypothetical protein ACK4SY_07065 [Pyrobaculum sp.]